MKLDSIQLIYFSPTGTTQKVLSGILRGIEVDSIAEINLTLADAKTTEDKIPTCDLAIIGTPVYCGRIPVTAVERLEKLNGNNTPAVIVVVYGNNKYGDALRELKDIAVKAGFLPIGSAAFIGEHSFASFEFPIANGRPDVQDYHEAKRFGLMVHKKLYEIRNHAGLTSLYVPGNFPYQERTIITGHSPTTKEASCKKCRQCATVCPVTAITIGKAVVTDDKLCTACCACIKSCSNSARIMEDPFIAQIGERLSNDCQRQKAPEIYI